MAERTDDHITHQPWHWLLIMYKEDKEKEEIYHSIKIT